MDALEDGGHVTSLDGLEDLEDGLEVGVLGGVGAGVDGGLEAATQGALRVAAAQQLADLAVELASLGLGDLGQRRHQRADVEVLRRVRVQRVDVDRAPGIAERRRCVLLDDGHFPWLSVFFFSFPLFLRPLTWLSLSLALPLSFPFLLAVRSKLVCPFWPGCCCCCGWLTCWRGGAYDRYPIGAGPGVGDVGYVVVVYTGQAVAAEPNDVVGFPNIDTQTKGRGGARKDRRRLVGCMVWCGKGCMVSEWCVVWCELLCW